MKQHAPADLLLIPLFHAKYFLDQPPSTHKFAHL